MPVRVGVLKETLDDEQRVAMTPDTAERFIKLGVQVLMETGAGARSHIIDADYPDISFIENPIEIYVRADVILRVQPPTPAEIEHMTPGKILVGFMQPYRSPERVELLRDKHITSLAMELLPRISRAQSMDALSSQAAIAGYKAALLGANLAPRFFPMLTSAAGTLRPATVLVIGAGVAGLQAIATARRLGAIVEAYDVRKAAREQVLSLGAHFLEHTVNAETAEGYARELSETETQHELDMLATHIALANVVITTAAVPNRPAPVLIDRYMVEHMQPGSVIIDLAAESGGNCSLTQAGKTVLHHGVLIHGPKNLASQLPLHASQMYARNLFNLVELMIRDRELRPNWQDEILACATLTRDGQIQHAPTRDQLEGEPA